MAQNLKSFPSLQETCIWPLGREDPLEKGMAAHSSILVWRTSWTEEPGGQQSMKLQRVRHDWVTNPSWVYICVYIYIYTYIYVHGFAKIFGDVFKYWCLRFKWYLSTLLQHLLLFHSIPCEDTSHGKNSYHKQKLRMIDNLKWASE